MKKEENFYVPVKEVSIHIKDISILAKKLVNWVYGEKKEFKIINTIGNDKEYTMHAKNDLRPIICSYRSDEDGKMNNASVLMVFDDEILEHALKRDPFPISDEDFAKLEDTCSAIILLVHDYKGKGHTFQKTKTHGKEINLMIKNLFDFSDPTK